MEFTGGFEECLNYALLSNNLHTLESLLPVKNFLNYVINEDGETLILRALKLSKNELVLDIINKYKSFIEIESSLVNFMNGWTCFHYLAAQKAPHIFLTQLNLCQFFLTFDWEDTFKKSLLPCKLISSDEGTSGFFFFFLISVRIVTYS
jgi:hypothetical protein